MVEKRIDPNHFRVAIFGSARIEKTSPVYKKVNKLAEMIACENIDVITGGGPGLMHAANSGHNKGSNGKDAHSIGLNIKLPKEQYYNNHLDIKRDFDKFSNRLDDFMKLSNAVVVAPGGIGTVLELFYTWQLTQVGHICDIPIILYGDMWDDLILWMKKKVLRRKLVSKSDFDNIFIAKNCREVIDIIKKAKKEFEENKDVCKNIKKYK